MRRLRWAMDGGGFWELDQETPATMEGTARPVAAHSRPGGAEGDGCCRHHAVLVPLGLSRGARLSRAKQLDFMRRFMASPVVPSFSGPGNGGPGLALHHADIFHLRDSWSAALMEQFHLQKFLSCVKKKAAETTGSASAGSGAFSWIRNMVRSAMEAYQLGFGTEILVTPDSSVLVEAYGDGKDGSRYRSKAVFHQKFPQHNLTLEAATPGLFVDKHGVYWDVPLSMAFDFSSTSSGSGTGYHLCLQHNSGQPKNFCDGQSSEVPPVLLPGFCAKAAFSIKKNVDIWRKKGGKMKMVQPYDVFHSDPHISASGTIGSVVSAFLGDNSSSLSAEDGSKRFKALSLHFPQRKSSICADSFASVSCTMQHGNFQKLFFDLTRLHACADFPSGSALLAGSACLAKDLYDSRRPDPDVIQAVCPDVTLSLQQQIVGPISFRVESRIALNSQNGGHFARLEEPIFALEYAMQVLSSARATAWYSPKRQEAMVELRFFES